jgi:hypothetical protein
MKITPPGSRPVQMQRGQEKPGGVEMEAFKMTLERWSHLALLVGVSLIVMVANVAFSVLYMVVYSYWIDPGHDNKYYQDHIQIAAPYCSIIAGIPLMFAAGWVVSGWRQGKFAFKPAVVVWIAYASIDLAILLAAGITFRVGVLFVISFATKLVAIYFGATYRIRRDNRVLERAQSD